MARFGKEGIVERLIQLDDDLLAMYPDKEPFALVVVGGSAIVLRDLAPDKSYTIDIDVLQTAAELEELLERYDINTDVDTFRFSFPAGYESRLVEVDIPLAKLKVFTLSNEDLAITKMLAWRDRDIEDLSSMCSAGSIDIARLRRITADITEVQININASDWESFLERLDSVETWASQ